LETTFTAKTSAVNAGIAILKIINMKKIILNTLFFSVILLSCKKDETPEFVSTDKGGLKIEFDNVVGGKDLELNTGSYLNTSGETYTISKFDYFISNIKLKNENGTEYIVPKDSSYFLLMESDPEQVIELRNIPAGNYSAITFTIGVDSLKCTAPVDQRTGTLDPATTAAGMYWAWNSGYIFLKMEGSSEASTIPDKNFYYHIGGFGGYSTPTINNIKTVTLQAPFGEPAKVRKDKATPPEIHVMADASKVLDGSTKISIAANSMVMFTNPSVIIANNYAQMFKIDHVHND
jgi:hypothetical protein